MAFMVNVPGANWGATSMSAMDAPAPAIDTDEGTEEECGDVDEGFAEVEVSACGGDGDD